MTTAITTFRTLTAGHNVARLLGALALAMGVGAMLTRSASADDRSIDIQMENF